MFQLLPILLVAVVLAADGGLAGRGFGELLAVMVALAPMVLTLLVLGATVRWCTSRLDRGTVPGPIILADRAMRWGIAIILVAHGVAVLGFGWLRVIREVTGNLILVDELLALAPPLIGVVCTWWLYYPIERRLREAVMIRRLDDGVPVYPVPSRARYVLAQARLHLLLLLVPILLILALDEVIEWAIQFAPEQYQLPVIADGLTLVCGLCVFLGAPLLARGLLSLSRVPDGPLRRDLTEICRRHAVRIRDILLWGTGGTMINAAVMGLAGRLRFVMISDALIESMPRPQVLAVMAHEVGHVRRRHMVWLVLCLLAVLAASEMTITGARWALAETGAVADAWPPSSREAWIEGIWTLLTLIPALWIFGWVSRRFERQADTFAVQHLSGLNAPGDRSLGEDAHASELPADEPTGPDLPNPAPGRVSSIAVNAMVSALHTVARLNHVNPRKHGWRHGSIAWRTSYLQTLVDRSIDGLAIDRQIRWIKRICGTFLLLLLAYILWAEWSVIEDAWRQVVAKGQ